MHLLLEFINFFQKYQGTSLMNGEASSGEDSTAKFKVFSVGSVSALYDSMPKNELQKKHAYHYFSVQTVQHREALYHQPAKKVSIVNYFKI